MLDPEETTISGAATLADIAGRTRTIPCARDSRVIALKNLISSLKHGPTEDEISLSPAWACR